MDALGHCRRQRKNGGRDLTENSCVRKRFYPGVENGGGKWPMLEPQSHLNWFKRGKYLYLCLYLYILTRLAIKIYLTIEVSKRMGKEKEKSGDKRVSC